MNFVHPQSLWALIPAAAIIAAAVLTRRTILARLHVIGADTVERQVRLFLMDICMALFMILIITAAADPRGRRNPNAGNNTNLDTAVLFDVSRSMLTEDVPPNRLKAGIAALGQVIQALEGSRFSLIPFKGDAKILVPMTEDIVMLRLWMDRLGPNIFSSTGTNLEASLRTAMKSFPEGTAQRKIILLITDGEALSGNINRISRDLLVEGITVYAAATGTEEGGPIPSGNGSYVSDKSGSPAVSRADFRTMEQLAEDTGGSVYNLSRADAVSRLVDAIVSEQNFSSRRSSFVGLYQYRLYLFPALLMLFFYLCIRIWPWRK
ncbi:MAG: hypothetical protein B0D92_02880 [Spirochaeta sp. LUC14_002_19_P3]|nr:MAG: hypothetical protein B0D92_02880 [Spirochaeta sp. LUC14_002_19_P3]